MCVYLFVLCFRSFVYSFVRSFFYASLSDIWLFHGMHRYAYVSMGEYAAVLAAACLTLEYGVSGAAVARSWGDKVLEWSSMIATTTTTATAGTEEYSDTTSTTNTINNDSSSRESFFNPLAGLISFSSVCILACGVNESKRITNFFTMTKLVLVLFMILGGLYLFEPANMTPFFVVVSPAITATTTATATATATAASGIIRGATSSFFGYLGFDEVCCLAKEAKNPNDVPKAILYTLAIVTVVYVFASIALCGMVPYDEISDTSGFPQAFYSRDILWASHVAAFGYVSVFPSVLRIHVSSPFRFFYHHGLCTLY